MAKNTDLKVIAKKLQKEVVSLKNKLKGAEKQAKASVKAWLKKHQAYKNEADKKLESTHEAAYKEGLMEAEKRNAARRRALRAAEVAFDKDYKVTKGKKGAKKVKVKTKKATKVKAKGKAIKSKPAKQGRPAKVAKKVTHEKAAGAKRRGRPRKVKHEQLHREEMIHPMHELALN
jgi:hypothetical protein